MVQVSPDPRPTRRRDRGSSLIEVLVTLLLMSLGMLGLAGLQTRLSQSELESYQRSQAILLLEDMANRLALNRVAAASYVTGTSNPLGAGMTCATATTTQVQRDLRDWCLSLQGAAETSGGASVGAMMGGRGCVESLGSNEYLITVAWQGMGAVSAPPATLACGQNLYDASAGACSSDRCRRVVTTLVRVGTL